MDNIIKTKPQIDSLWVSFSTDAISLSNKLNISIFSSFFKQFGAIESPKGNDCYLYDTGLGLSFYLGYKPKSKKYTHLQVKADGKFNCLSNSYQKTYKIIKEIQKKFGLIPIVQRIDIAQVLMSKDYSLRNPYYYFPDIRSEKVAKMKLKGIKKSNIHFPLNIKSHHNDETNKALITGLTISNSKFLIKSYEKRLQIVQDYMKGKISQGYYEYWMKIFQENEVKSAQRLELSLLRESCKLATALIFSEEQIEESDICEAILSYFVKSHRVYDYNPDNDNYEEPNKVWDELFCIEKYRSLKEVKTDLNISPNLKSFKHRPTEPRSIHSLSKSLAKALNNEGYENIDFILINLYELMKEDMKNQKEELSQYEETLKFFGTSQEELEEIREKIFYFKDKIKSLSHKITEEEKLLDDLLNINID